MSPSVELSVEAIQTALSSVLEPEIGRPLAELGLIREGELDGTAARIGVDLTSPVSSSREKIGADVEAAAKAAGVESVTIDWGVKVLERDIREDDPCPSVRNIVLVMSGKGGVGKSTVATNMALALTRAGCRVGLLDADMYGPSIPTMLGVSERPKVYEEGKIEPVESLGIKLMSIGFLLDDDKAAVIWRGPMLQGALLQFLRDVNWGELDYLVIDCPPGTGDIALTISQQLRTSGAVVVTTPQQVALADVYKSVAMLQKVGIPIAGIVENESYFVCDGCDKRHELFGAGGGAKVAAFAEAPLLGQIPLHPAVRECADSGVPIVQAAPASGMAKAFTEVAQRMADRVSVLNASRAPSLTIDRSGGKNRHLPIAR